MRQNALLFLFMVGAAVFSAQGTSASCPAGETGTALARPGLSEEDSYVDLNTGKTFQVIYDGLNDKFERADLFAFDIYVSTRTSDTFWLAEALPVNNALLRDKAGKFRVDPMKVKRDGDGYKVINNRAVAKPAESVEAEKQPQAAASTM